VREAALPAWKKSLSFESAVRVPSLPTHPTFSKPQRVRHWR
jgi:hypothetical protein